MGCLWVLSGQCEGERRVWKRRGSYAYRFVVLQWRGTETREVAEVFHLFCGVCSVDWWVAGGLYKNTGVVAAL